jgi:hypothetical protein
VARVRLEPGDFYHTLWLTEIFDKDPRIVLEGTDKFYLEARAIDEAVATGGNPHEVAQRLLDEMNVMGAVARPGRRRSGTRRLR